MPPPWVGVIMILILTLLRTFAIVIENFRNSGRRGRAGRVGTIPGRTGNPCTGWDLLGLYTRRHCGTSTGECALMNIWCVNLSAAHRGSDSGKFSSAGRIAWFPASTGLDQQILGGPQGRDNGGHDHNTATACPACLRRS